MGIWTDAGGTVGSRPGRRAETITSQTHLFHLTAVPPTTYSGGSLQQAHEDNFPILKGQQASIQLIRLAPDGIREPHWHPSASFKKIENSIVILRSP